MSLAAQTAAFSPTYKTQKISVIRSWISEHVFLLNAVSLMLLLVLLVSYIVQVNSTISKGYQIRDLETQVNELTLLNQKTELEVRQSQSLDRVERSVKMLGFIRADMPNYVSASEPAYALAE